ncbi:MAG: CDC27 family protein [Campylobacterales bacterium]|nr:CDC27 family protein [Campylobacterales bacterium]
MLNLNELEKQWLHYKIKSYFPHAIILSSTLIIFVIVAFTLNNKTDKIKSNDSNTTAIQSEPLTNKAVVQEIVVTEAIDTNTQTKNEQIKLQETKVFIAPSLGFMDKIQNNPSLESSTKQIPVASTTVTKTPVIAQAPTVEIIENDNAILNVKPMITDKEVAKNISIKRQNTQEDIELIIKRFKKSNNPALSLFIAKTYYEMGDYNLAYNYALITNGLDNNIEASWIIFAKSLVKLDQKDKAIATLKEYLKHSNSTNAKTLLDELVSEGMK